MNSFRVGGTTFGGSTFGGGVSLPGLGKASTSTGINVPKVGSVSANAGIDVSKGLSGITGGIELKKDNGNVFTSGASKKSAEDVSHQAISSYFIGPQAENLTYFKENVNVILDRLKDARVNYFPEDGEFIDDGIQISETFQKRTKDVAKSVDKLSELLGAHSIPFWSPRYQAHMCMDMNMPALLGYFATMIYNPNNVAFEASPLSTVAEVEVGQQLCEMLGYKASGEDQKQDEPVGWSHITCDGTVANLESIWVARNLKYYPLSIRKALDGPLDFISETFTVRTARNEEKLYKHLSTWELLNLRPQTILDIPDRLNRDYNISSKFLEDIMNEYGIQSRGKESLDRDFGIEKPAQYLLSNTKHYSWPKGGGEHHFEIRKPLFRLVHHFPDITTAIAGIGSDNMVGVTVDNGARVDVSELEKHLEERLSNEQPVYAVVAIIGSTEEGAVDPLGQILAQRRRFQARGLSYVVHADAAWGGYFASMLPRDFIPGSRFSDNLPVGLGSASGFVPDSPLRVETQEDIWWMRQADSITVDPHKAGYIPYPAGSLSYRDGRMRYLITWTSPYLSQGSTTSIGIYGLEGSKPGASAVSTYMANQCIGLNPEGYGALLGEATFSSSRISAQWAAMTDSSMPFVVVPFNMLPSELASDATPESIEAEKQWIRDNILRSSNLDIVSSSSTSPGGDSALSLLRKLGSDLNINAFAINFRNRDGTLNTDTLEANYLMRRVVERFSVDSPSDDPTKIPLYLTSTEFSPELYGACAENFKKRLGLAGGGQDLFVLRNVVMSPFPTERDFVSELAGIFMNVVAEEVKVCQMRNEVTKGLHEFVVHGADDVFLVHKPSFHVANHRRQTILGVDMPADIKDLYCTLKTQFPEELWTFSTTEEVDLSEVINGSAHMVGYLKSKMTGPMLPSFQLQAKHTWVDRPLTGPSLSIEYPTTRMPFYLYGSDISSLDSPSQQLYMDHALLCSPNIQLSASIASLSFPSSPKRSATDRPLVLFLDDVREGTMQPFPTSNATLASLPNFFFAKDKEYSISIWQDPVGGSQDGEEIWRAWEGLGKGGSEEGLVGRGKAVLGEDVWVDSEQLNFDPYKPVDNTAAWKKEFSKIGSA
ncbi:Pyridoxal phosphate-dependent decarboxylase [Macrophomina phaseolina MS6]|uniref:Pyridoxal phosphate-dependent decarboxylase n=1 Tax=Macrophomina phaseolina (strain MS6) TaxID=1126212 RepID=K2SCM2_MACPH|nr:Pyridoxal phosphate-dependent decarboxylase [Macrophomina phaseolina MS6]